MEVFPRNFRRERNDIIFLDNYLRRERNDIIFLDNCNCNNILICILITFILIMLYILVSLTILFTSNDRNLPIIINDYSDSSSGYYI